MSESIPVLPVIIHKKGRTMEDVSKYIYAFRTTVSKETTIDEIKALLEKLKITGWRYGELENGVTFFQFRIPDPVYGDVWIHKTIPRIIVTTQKVKNRYLEKESYRLVWLDIKQKIYFLDVDNPRPLMLFIENALTKQGKPLKQLLMETDSMRQLLPPKE